MNYEEQIPPQPLIPERFLMDKIRLNPEAVEANMHLLEEDPDLSRIKHEDDSFKLVGATIRSKERKSKGEANEDSMTAVFKYDGFSMIAIMDGLGGIEGGEIASRGLKKYLENECKNSPTPKTKKEAEALVDRAIKQTLAVINEPFKNYPRGYFKPDTTFTILLNVPTAGGMKHYICHSGDTSLYLLKNKKLIKLTEDDTLVREKALNLNELEQKIDVRKHVMTQTLQSSVNGPRYHFYELNNFEVGVSLIFLSDGINDGAREDNIEEGSNELENWVNASDDPVYLIAAARTRHGQNIEGLSKDDDCSVMILRKKSDARLEDNEQSQQVTIPTRGDVGVSPDSDDETLTQKELSLSPEQELMIRAKNLTSFILNNWDNEGKRIAGMIAFDQLGELNKRDILKDDHYKLQLYIENFYSKYPSPEILEEKFSRKFILRLGPKSDDESMLKKAQYRLALNRLIEILYE